MVPASVFPKFSGRRALLATKHGKESAIAPVLLQRLGLRVEVPDFLDTDVLGTFSGEIPPTGSARERLERKARLAMEQTDCSLALATEAEFAAHPSQPDVAFLREWMILLDVDSGEEFVESVDVELVRPLHLETPPDGTIEHFLAAAAFPTNGLIVRPATGELTGLIFKGIRNRRVLDLSIQFAANYSDNGLVRLEVDMRANQNPGRMEAIRQVTELLATRLRER